MLVPFPAPEISAPRLRGNRRAGVGGLDGRIPAAFGSYYVYDQENVTTDKKSSLSERLKAIRDKVAGAITAAEEEETSVAGLVSPDETAVDVPAQETEIELPVHRASNDEIASALMKFTWANERPQTKEPSEEVMIFCEDYPTEAEQDAGAETIASAAEPPFSAVSPEAEEAGHAVDEVPEADKELYPAAEMPQTDIERPAAPEMPEVKEAPSAPEEESESARWDRIIAEAEALLREDMTDEAAPPFDEESGPADEPIRESDTAEADLPEAIASLDSDSGEKVTTESDFGHEAETLPEQGQQTAFSWTDLMSGIREEDHSSSQPEPAETGELLQGIPEEPDTDIPASVGTGLAALLANLRNNAQRQQTGENKSEETPDISMFLQDYENDQPEIGAADDEPDPSDVARLWEPRAERRAGEGIPSDPSVDPNREETHVFTEEDLKNLPKEDGSSGSADSSVSNYQDYDDEEEGYTPRDFRPIRRRRYYRTGLVGGIMYFLFVLCVSVALACFAWLAADDMLSLNKEYTEAVVYVGEDMDVDQVATELKTKGLIRYRRLFALFGKFFHAEEKIEPGTYTLSTKLDYRALIQNMHHYTGWTGEALATVKVTIPEGKTVMETFQILAEHGVCPYETLMECAAKETFDYAFLKDIPKGDATRLEGYLFPDTYEFYADSSPKAAICRFLDNFGDRIGDRVMEQAAAQGYSLREIITVASLIEKEAGNDLERAKIASVIYNRLQSTSYPYLQIDATIQYAMGEHKEHLTYDDLQVDSPYNTYLYPGLPPGPISNPGLASIRAALNPESTGYYFYALNKNGMHEFFSSYNAFQRFINSSDFGG